MIRILFIGLFSCFFTISISGQEVPNDTISSKDTFWMQQLRQVVDVSERDRGGRTALMHCFEYNNLELTKELLIKGSSVNDISDSEYTPLMYAVITPGINLEIVDLLLNYGADLNYSNSKGESAFSLSYLHNNIDIAYYLLLKGAKIPTTDFEIQAKLNHFSGDCYLMKGELDTCKGFYIGAKQFYTLSLNDPKQKLAKINGAKARAFLGDVMLATAVNLGTSYIQTNQMQGWQNLGMSRSNAYLMTMPQAESLRKIYSPLYEKNSILLFNEQCPAGASIDQKKYFYKNKIKQLEMLIELMDGIVACIEKGLSGEELNSCITEIKLSKESKEREKNKKKSDKS